jgi:DUF971 family protein
MAVMAAALLQIWDGAQRFAAPQGREVRRMNQQNWPTELRLAKDRRSLTVTFEDGSTFSLAAEYLRVASPSAEVQGHSPSQRQTVPGKRNVEVLRLEPVGNYAVRLVFDDMHDSGLYTWDYLHELGLQHEQRWSAYLAELEQKGLSREPRAGRR